MTPDQLQFGFTHQRVTPESLTAAVGLPVDLLFTDNTSTMLTVRRDTRGVTVRVHRMFEWVPPGTFDALARYCRKGRGRYPELSRHVDDHRHLIRRRREKSAPDPVKARGRHFDLVQILSGVHKNHFPDLRPAAITWGRPSRGRRRIQLAVYDPENHVVRVNPRLDREWVPKLVIEFLVYHELCHAWLITEAKREGRKDGHFHNRRFRDLEKRFPGYDEVLAWERQHVSRL